MADITLSGNTNPLGKALLISEALGYSEQGSVPFPITLSKSGGMGFQYEGGVITVLATNPQVRVTFDRPMIYNGDFTPNPTGPFDIGQPVLVPGATALDIPITVAAQTLDEPTVTNQFGSNIVIVTWPEPVDVVTYEGWWISTNTGAWVNILSYDKPSSVRLFISEPTDGATYTLNIPAGKVVGATGKVNLAIAKDFVATAIKPTIYRVVANSPTTFTIIYDEPMDYGTVTDVNNYDIPGLTIIGIEYQDQQTFRVTTSPMIPGTAYTLTVTGVKDAAGNEIL